MKPLAALDSPNFNIFAGVNLVDAMAEGVFTGLALALCDGPLSSYYHSMYVSLIERGSKI
jgi:hypothetical protein